MPYFSFDEDTYDEIAEMAEMAGMSAETAAPPDNYEKDADGAFRGYEPASAQFTSDDLEEAERRVLKVLQERGVTGIRCLYDGGGDEGFAHFEAAIIADTPVPLTVLCAELAGGPLSEVPQDPRIYRSGDWDQIPREQRAREALDDLAYALASRLLGNSFGTGEYSMYGAFHANFHTGAIVDDPNVSDPDAVEGHTLDDDNAE